MNDDLLKFIEKKIDQFDSYEEKLASLSIAHDLLYRISHLPPEMQTFLTNKRRAIQLANGFEEKVIKRILDVDVDGLKKTIKYTITEMYNLISKDDIAEIKFRLIDEFTMTWDEVDQEEKEMGHSMKTEIYDVYNIGEVKC